MSTLLVDLDGPARLDLSFVSGFQWELDTDVYDDEDGTSEHTFVGESVLWILRRRRDPDAPEITRATVDDGRIVVAAVLPAPDTPTGTGRLEILIPGGATADIAPGCYWYWLSSWPVGNQDAEQGWLEGRVDVRAGNGA